MTSTLRVLLGSVLFCLAYGTSGSSLFAQDAISGRLVIIGGALDVGNDAVFEAILEARSGTGPICVLPTASDSPDESMAAAVAALDAHGGPGGPGGHGGPGGPGGPSGPSNAMGIRITTDNPRAATDPAVVAELRSCSGYFFTDGDPSRIVDTFRPDESGTPAYEVILSRVKAGAVLAGTGAGAAMMSDPMIAGGPSGGAILHGVRAGADDDGVFVRNGMGFFTRGLIDQHFSARGRMGRLLVAVLGTPGVSLGFGIDENTALVVDANGLWVVGASGVVVVDVRGTIPMGRGAMGIGLNLMGPGDRFDPWLGMVEVLPGKERLPFSRTRPEAPLDVFAPWVFLEALYDFSRAPRSTMEIPLQGGALTLFKGPGFRAWSSGLDGLAGSPHGFSAGPFRIDLNLGS